MALEPLEARRRRLELDAAQAKRNEGAFAAEARAIEALHERAGVPLGERVRADFVVQEPKARRGPSSNKSLPGPPENKDEAPADGLSGVSFASSAAEQAARDAGLTSADFRGRRHGSPNGYTVADVRKITE